VRSELLADLSERYTPEAYSLFHNNCNTFSNELAELLCGRGVPAHITGAKREGWGHANGRVYGWELRAIEGKRVWGGRRPGCMAGAANRGGECRESAAAHQT
jgi:hypothetical protein